MSNSYFQFKQFIIHQDNCAMKVCTDACILGAFTAERIQNLEIKNVLDIGCGTGLLSLMIAQKTNAPIVSVEVNKDAALQASENITASAWSDRIKLIHTSVQEFETGKYHLIITNPPFYEDDLKSASEYINAARHDTRLTFTALLHFIKDHLEDNGIAAVLLPFHRTKYFEEATYKESLFVKEKLLIKQTPSHDYFRSILLLSKNLMKNIQVSELSIHDGKRNYTVLFKNLLKDYYLNL